MDLGTCPRGSPGGRKGPGATPYAWVLALSPTHLLEFLRDAEIELRVEHGVLHWRHPPRVAPRKVQCINRAIRGSIMALATLLHHEGQQEGRVCKCCAGHC